MPPGKIHTHKQDKAESVLIEELSESYQLHVKIQREVMRAVI